MRPRTLVSSFLSKVCRRGLDNGGVKVRAEIGKLSALHTLGVVNVNASCGTKAIFKALKKLTQLRKLGVSGINKGNIKETRSFVKPSEIMHISNLCQWSSIKMITWMDWIASPSHPRP